MLGKISREVLKSNFKSLNGFMPVYKPPGMCSHRLSEGLRLDMYFVFEHLDLNYGEFHVHHAKDLDPFADGLMTFVFGQGKARRKNFVLADYRYKADIEFGVQRMFNTIEGQILDRSPTKDITSARIKNVLPNFIGEIEQKRCPSYRNVPPFTEGFLEEALNNIDSDNERTYIDHYNAIILPPKPGKINKKPQKYPYVAPSRTYLVRDIQLESYVEPNATFTISCRGGFSVRNFAADLADQLGTHANVVKLTRLQEGPMHLDDIRVFQPYETNVEYYILRLKSLRKLYSDFNDEIEPLWEDIST